MSVEVANVMVAIQQFSQIAQVAAEPVGRDRRVLPAFPRRMVARDVRRGPEARLAHLPDLLLVDAVVEHARRWGAPLLLQIVEHPAGVRVRLLPRVAAELHEQPPATRRQLLQRVFADADVPHIADQPIVHAFQADRLVLEDLRHLVGCRIDVGIAEHHQCPRPRAVDETDRRLEHGHARALAADERARDVEPLFRQQPRQVVARDATRDLRIFAPNRAGMLVDQRAQLRVNVAAAASVGHNARALLVGRRADAQARAVVQQDVELLDVLVCLAGHQRVNAARVVADHPAQRAVIVCGRIGRERQVITLGGVPQTIENNARLHARPPRVRIEGDDAVHVLRTVDDDRDVATLAGEAGAAAASDDRRAVTAADAHGRDDVIGVAREDDAQRHLAVIRSVRRVQGA